MPMTPALALRYLAELTPGLRGAAVATLDGRTLAGDAALAGRAVAMLDGVAAGEARRSNADGATVFAARSDAHLIALACGPGTLPALVLADLHSALGDLER